MSAREDARRAWRERVNAAARKFSSERARIADLWNRVDRTYAYGEAHVVAMNLHRALAAPKPWRSSRKPDARRRYSRAHRRACGWCRAAHEGRNWCARVFWLWTWRRVPCAPGGTLKAETHRRQVTDPHGRRA